MYRGTSFNKNFESIVSSSDSLLFFLKTYTQDLELLLAFTELGLTNEQKMLVLQDFLYNRPMLDYSSDNRIEENSKMMDCVLLTLHLDNIILDVHNSKVKEEGFSVCVDEVSVHARLHLIERNHESIATSAKISVKRLQLENFQLAFH